MPSPRGCGGSGHPAGRRGPHAAGPRRPSRPSASGRAGPATTGGRPWSRSRSRPGRTGWRSRPRTGRPPVARRPAAPRRGPGIPARHDGGDRVAHVVQGVGEQHHGRTGHRAARAASATSKVTRSADARRRRRALRAYAIDASSASMPVDPGGRPGLRDDERGAPREPHAHVEQPAAGRAARGPPRRPPAARRAASPASYMGTGETGLRGGHGRMVVAPPMPPPVRKKLSTSAGQPRAASKPANTPISDDGRVSVASTAAISGLRVNVPPRVVVEVAGDGDAPAATRAGSAREPGPVGQFGRLVTGRRRPARHRPSRSPRTMSGADRPRRPGRRRSSDRGLDLGRVEGGHVDDWSGTPFGLRMTGTA